MPQPRGMPRPARRSAQGVTSSRRRRRGGGNHRVGFGTQRASAQVLAAWGWTSHTAFGERLPRALRQRVAALGRRGHTRCQGAAGVREQWPLCQVSHHVVVPHASGRQGGTAPLAPNGRGWATLGRRCTPALAAGVTDHGWSLPEGRWSRGPPWPQTQRVSNRIGVEERGGEPRADAQRQATRDRRRVASRARGLLTG